MKHYIRLLVVAASLAFAIFFADNLVGIKTADAQTDLLLERRLSQIEQRFYLLESRLSRLEQTPSILPQSPNRNDAEIGYLRTQLDAQRAQIEGLRMRISDLECAAARLDERTLTPAARQARRSNPDGTEQCRSNPTAPVKLMARP